MQLQRPVLALPSRRNRIVLGGLGVAAVGLTVFLAPPMVSAAGLALLGIGIPGVWLLWTQPEWGVLTIVFLTSSVIQPDQIDIRLPIGGLDLRDIMLLGMLGLLVLKQGVRRNFHLPRSPITMPLVLFLGLGVFSALRALLVLGIDPVWTLSEARAIAFYAMFFLVTLEIRERRQLLRLLVGLVVLAGITAVLIIAQQFRGSNLLAAGMQSTSWQVLVKYGSAGEFGAIRVVPPGHVLVFLASILSFNLLLFAGWRGITSFGVLLTFLFMNVGLLFTYTRSQWLASLLALGLSVLATPVRVKARMLVAALVLVPTLIMLVYAFPNGIAAISEQVPFITPLYERFHSIFTPEDTLDTYSLQGRILETETSLEAIGRAPVFGLGLGAAYRNITRREAESGYTRFTRFIHNSYLYIATKMGLITLLAFLLFCGTTLLRGTQIFRMLHDPLLKAVALGSTVAFAGMMGWSVFFAHMFLTESTNVIGVTAALAEVCYQVSERARFTAEAVHGS
ncbi:MAG: O-antigen ligase domain-containing protein [Chloroflexi bacterium]|nr:MAG: O-antigen ligase domain-containing protein [Chloroflexota bacterium]